MRSNLRIVYLLFLVAGTLTAQPNENKSVQKVIDHFFTGLQKGDTLIMKESLADKVVLQTAFINKNGESVLRNDDFDRFLGAVAGKNPDDLWEEKLQSYNIQIDGNMAHAWTPYEFYLNKKFSHCGVNSFQLFHDGTDWKVIYLIDTRRRNCNIE